MSQAKFEAKAHAETLRPLGGRIAGPALAVLAVTAAALLSGCANRDSVTVGSIPDDYRTNHPIVISEKAQKLDLPVASSDRGMTQMQRETLLGFLDGYDRSAAPVLTIAAPAGSVNEVAARAAARDFAKLATRNGVPSGRVAMLAYQADPAALSAPVRVAFASLRAHTDRCGRWPQDLLETTDNKHYADFGCSYQNNLAAQVANPADLLGPRKQTPIDAERRDVVIDGYRKAPFYSPTPGTEVNY